MPALSLQSLATKACIKNIQSLTDVGDFEYWKIRPVLARITNPLQLAQIEENSPQIRGEDADLWRAFIARDVPNWRTKGYVPKNPLKWGSVYNRYKTEQREEIEEAQNKLRKSMMAAQKHRDTNVSKLVDVRSVKVPRDPRMRANDGGVPLVKKGFAKQGPSSLMWNLGSKTKLTDGKSVLTKARREAKEISQRSKLSKPTTMLSGKVDQVRRAPAGMVNEYRTAAQPPLKILSSKRSTSTFEGGVSGPSLEEREQRLRAFTMKMAEPGVKQTLVGSSDDEDFDEADDAEDLFDEKPISRPSSSRPSPISPKSSAVPRPSRPSPISSSTSKPSDFISSLVTKPKSASTSRPNMTSSPLRSTPSIPAPQKSSTSAGGQKGTGTPPLGARPMMPPRKRPQVDVFNRGPKKPRLR